VILFYRNSASKQRDKKKTTILHQSSSIQVELAYIHSHLKGDTSHNWFKLYEKWKLQMHWEKTPQFRSSFLCSVPTLLLSLNCKNSFLWLCIPSINYKQIPINFKERATFWMQQRVSMKGCHSVASHNVGGRSLGFATTDSDAQVR